MQSFRNSATQSRLKSSCKKSHKLRRRFARSMPQRAGSPFLTPLQAAAEPFLIPFSYLRWGMFLLWKS